MRNGWCKQSKYHQFFRQFLKLMAESSLIGLNGTFAALNASSPGRIWPICSADLRNSLKMSYLLNYPLVLVVLEGVAHGRSREKQKKPRKTRTAR